MKLDDFFSERLAHACSNFDVHSKLHFWKYSVPSGSLSFQIRLISQLVKPEQCACFGSVFGCEDHINSRQYYLCVCIPAISLILWTCWKRATIWAWLSLLWHASSFSTNSWSMDFNYSIQILVRSLFLRYAPSFTTWSSWQFNQLLLDAYVAAHIIQGA